MSTRGAYGVRHGGQDYITYNHSDSYPSGLGLGILAQTKELLKKYTLLGLARKAKNLVRITEGMVPTQKDIEALAPWTDLSVGSGSTSDWYCLTRGAQGSLLVLFECGYINDSSDFLLDSLFCEYAYIMNLDDKVLEVYQGFNKNPKADGRYAAFQRPLREDEGTYEYYGVRLVATFKFTQLPSADAFRKKIGD